LFYFNDLKKGRKQSGNELPLDGIPLDGIPLDGIPLGGIPLGGIPLDGTLSGARPPHRGWRIRR